MKILKRKEYLSEDVLDSILKENNELISIFVKSYKTAKQNLEEEKRKK